MNLPADLKRYDPNFLCDLLDGLEGVPESLYRAWTLEHDDRAVGRLRRRDGGPLRLEWNGFGQTQMLLLDLQNTLDAVRVMLASHWSGKKREPRLILPPGADVPESRSSHVDAASSSGLENYMTRVQRAFRVE